MPILCGFAPLAIRRCRSQEMCRPSLRSEALAITTDSAMWSPIIFLSMHFFARVIGPMALCMALTYFRFVRELEFSPVSGS